MFMLIVEGRNMLFWKLLSNCPINQSGGAGGKGYYFHKDTAVRSSGSWPCVSAQPHVPRAEFSVMLPAFSTVL